MNAEIARLAHAEALRGAKCVHRRRREEPVAAEDRPDTPAERLASRFLPELQLVLATRARVASADSYAVR